MNEPDDVDTPEFGTLGELLLALGALVMVLIAAPDLMEWLGTWNAMGWAR